MARRYSWLWMVILCSLGCAQETATAGSDYEHTAGTLVFAPGSTSQRIRVPIIE